MLTSTFLIKRSTLSERVLTSGTGSSSKQMPVDDESSPCTTTWYFIWWLFFSSITYFAIFFISWNASFAESEVAFMTKAMSISSEREKTNKHNETNLLRSVCVQFGSMPVLEEAKTMVYVTNHNMITMAMVIFKTYKMADKGEERREYWPKYSFILALSSLLFVFSLLWIGKYLEDRE